MSTHNSSSGNSSSGGVNHPGRTFGATGTTHFSSSTSAPGCSYHSTRTPALSIADIPEGHGLHWSPAAGT